MSRNPPLTRSGYDAAAYWSERLAGEGGLEAAGWLGLGAAYNRWLYRQRRRVFLRVARHYGFERRAPRVLELGPGTGFYVDLWARLGVRELVGIDIAPPAVERLRRRFPAYRFEVGDIGGVIELPVGGFDVVTAFDVLFHITDDAAFDRAIATIAAALRPGGLALVTDLFPDRTAVKRAHQVSRSAARYRQCFAAHGLRLERRWPVFVLMHPWAGPRSGARGWMAGAWWWMVERVTGHVPGGGVILGAVLCGADGVLTRIAGTGPSTQLWAARRVGPLTVKGSHDARG